MAAAPPDCATTTTTTTIAAAPAAAPQNSLSYLVKVRLVQGKQCREAERGVSRKIKRTSYSLPPQLAANPVTRVSVGVLVIFQAL